MRAVKKTNNPQSPGAAELLDEANRSQNILLKAGDSPWHGDGKLGIAAAPHSSEASELRSQVGHLPSKCVCSKWGGGKIHGHPQKSDERSQSPSLALRQSQPCIGQKTAKRVQTLQPV